jgi:RNA polymerase sigma-70 factor, ECF subfamily
MSSDLPLMCDSERLTALMRAGDRDALEHLTRCFAARLMAVGRKYCRGEDEAEDAVQDALLAAGEHLEDFRGEGSPEGWLVRIVTNACRRMRRGRKNDPTLHDTLADHPLEAVHYGPEELVGRGELAVALGEALGELSAEDRAIVLLSDAQGWTAPEIAASLGRTPNAVRLRLSRARRRLREELQGLAP